VSERWQVSTGTDRRGEVVWKVLDRDDRSRPVAEFGDEAAARAHADRLGQGPFELDEQEAWQDEEDEDEVDAEVEKDAHGEDWPRSSW
jgi:hypothetical protein